MICVNRVRGRVLDGVEESPQKQGCRSSLRVFWLQIPEAPSGCFQSQNEFPYEIRDASWSPRVDNAARPQEPVQGAGAPSQRRGCGGLGG